jgi:predicted GIY-YIG superfamily endonuclease
VSGPKRFVYILKSVTAPHEDYVGVTCDPAARLEEHNADLSSATAARRPWRKLVVIEFDEEEPALEFERYLKDGFRSGVRATPLPLAGRRPAAFPCGQRTRFRIAERRPESA